MARSRTTPALAALLPFPCSGAVLHLSSAFFTPSFKPPRPVWQRSLPAEVLSPRIVSFVDVCDTTKQNADSFARRGGRDVQYRLRARLTSSDATWNESSDPCDDTVLPLSPLLESSSDAPRLLPALQSQASSVSSSFRPTKYDPHPLLANCHVQTIAGAFLRSDPNCTYVADGGIRGLMPVVGAVSSLGRKREGSSSPSQECNYYDERERIGTDDGDFFHVDYKYVVDPKDPASSRGTVIVVHGLESNSNSTLCTDMAESYVRQGFDVACLNFRGCCGFENEQLGGYHLGFTEDLRHFLSILSERRSGSAQRVHSSTPNKRFMSLQHPVYLSGFSLGANVVLKLLGELRENSISCYGIRGAAVVSAPFDLERNVNFIDAPGFNRAVYVRNFLRTLKVKAQAELDAHCGGDPNTTKFDYRRVMETNSIAEFDDAFIAPVYGFESNLDYYRQSSCVRFLDGIAVPTLIINAGDDPFFDPEYFPWEKGCEGGGRAPLKLVRTEHGGHLGFMFQRRDVELKGGSIVDGGAISSVAEKGESSSPSWMPVELARFVDHVHVNLLPKSAEFEMSNDQTLKVPKLDSLSSLNGQTRPLESGQVDSEVVKYFRRTSGFDVRRQ